MTDKKRSSNKTSDKKVGAKSTPTKSSSNKKAKSKLIISVLITAFSIFLLFAFFSFLFTAEADQSKLQISWFKLISDPKIKVDNFTGKTGAWLADIFINRWVGLSAFGFIYLLFAYSLRIWGVKIKYLLTKTLKTLIIILWFSISLGYFFAGTYSKASILVGGNYGYDIANWLNSMIGKFGTFFAILGTLLIYLIVVYEQMIEYLKAPHQINLNLKLSSKLGSLLHRDKNFDDNADHESEKDERSKKKPSEKIDKKNIDFEDDDDNEENVIVGDINIEKIKPEEDEIEIFNNQNSPFRDTLNERERIDDPEIESIYNDDEEEFEKPPIENFNPKLDLSNYKYPTIELLEDYSHLKSEVSDEELIENKNKIVETLRNFKIEIVKIKATIGPTVTLYEIVPAQGIRISKIKNLEDDIALSLSALGIRIIAPIPGRGTIGIEVPNRSPQIVSMRSIIGSKKFQESTLELPIALGKTISNEIFVFDLTKMPHILVAGATGQGKSVGLNAIIASLLYKKHPAELKFVFIDPKKVELSLYSSIERHFLAKLPDEDEPIITDVERVKATLNSLGREMDNRYDILKKAHVRNIKEYNDKFFERKLNPNNGHHFLPYIVVVIDEFADLIMTAGKEIELPIARIAQLARAVGIHMIIATQRPTTNIITGVIKANFPCRIAFKVASMIDSRTILDQPGANQLIGKGDMLFLSSSSVIRLQCAFLDTPELENICEHISSQQSYPTAFMLPEPESEGSSDDSVDLNQRDEFFDDAARLIVLNQQGSTSMIQRKFSIGYNRAGRIIDQLESAGIVGPNEGSKARKVYYQDEYSLEQKLNSLNK